MCPNRITKQLYKKNGFVIEEVKKFDVCRWKLYR